MLRAVLLVLSLTATGAFAQDCGPIPQRSALEDRLFADLKRARNEAEAQPINALLWEIWLEAPDPDAAQSITDGMEARRYADFPRAEEIFTTLIERCPDWAEGWNQRAFARFLAGDYGNALGDLEKAIERNPRHVGALSGMALTLFGLGRPEAGQGVLREALKLNPWLSERALLSVPTEPEGEDI